MPHRDRILLRQPAESATYGAFGRCKSFVATEYVRKTEAGGRQKLWLYQATAVARLHVQPMATSTTPRDARTLLALVFDRAYQ